MRFSELKLQEIQKQIAGSYFLYDLDGMESHLRSLVTPGVRLWYACKANPLSRILDTAAASGLSFDVASKGELRQVLSRGIPGKNILLTGPAKSEAFLQCALENGVETFVLESIEQALNLERLAKQVHRKVNVLLRLQLIWDSEESSVLGGSKTTVFGLDKAAWEKLEISQFSQLHFCGVHIFQWGNLLDEMKIEGIWKRIAAEAKSLCERLRFPLMILDLGGGLGIPYSPDQKSLSFSRLQEALQRLRSSTGAEEIWLELGRYAVGEYGVYVTKIVEKKVVNGKHFLLCEGGAHHLVRPALVGESFPCRAIGKTGTLERFAVHGPLCTALDQLGDYDLPRDLEKGDCLVFGQTGAYGFTESMPFFLCHDLPAELVWQKGKWETVRELQTAASWLR